MTAQAYPQNFPAPQTPVIDVQGKATKDFRYLWLALWNRTGQGSGIIPAVSGFPPSQNTAPLVASGTTQADGFQLIDDWNYFGTVGPGLACVLQALKPGQSVQVINDGANPLATFPAIGFQIDALAINASFALTAGKLRIFECVTLTKLKSYGN